MPLPLPIKVADIKPPHLKLPQIRNAPNAPALPNVKAPSIPLPPGTGRVIPSRTITSLIPGRVRDFVRFAQVVQQATPQSFVKGVTPPLRREVRFTPDTAIRGWLADASLGGDVLYFQFNPEEVDVSHDNGWVITDMPGRSHPFVQWGGSGQRKISFTLKLSYLSDELRSVVDSVNWIQSFLYPTMLNEKSGIASAPKGLYLYLGEILVRQQAPELVPCILLSAPATYSKLFRPGTLAPLYAEIKLELLVMVRPDAAIEVGNDRKSRTGDLEREARSAVQSIGSLSAPTSL